MSGIDQETIDLIRQVRELEDQMTPQERAEIDRLLFSPADNVKRYKKDPVLFAQEVLHVDLAPYQERILRALVKHRRVCVRGPHGMGKCIWYGDKMRLADGSLVPVTDLVDTSFQVLAVDDTMNVHIADAIAWDNGIQDVIEITTDKGRVLTRTLNHPLWIDKTPSRYISKEGRYRLTPSGSWVQAGDAEPGQTIAVYLGNDGSKGCDISDDDISLLSYLLGDGGLTRSVSFAQSPGIVLDDFIRICTNLGVSVKKQASSGDVTYRVTNGKGEPNAVLHRVKLWGLAGKNSYEKSFPSWVWKFDNRQLKLLLSRLYACDGWASIMESGSRQIGYCTVSYELAQDVSRALLRLGIQSEIRKKISRSQNETEVLAYHVNIHDVKNIILFCENVGIFGKEDAVGKVYDHALSASKDKAQKWRSSNLPDQFAWETIVSTRLLRNQPTVAITVPEYGTFLTDFVEHNTTISAIIILWFIAVHEECKIPTTASAWRQLKEFLWPEIHKWALKADWWKVGLVVRPEKELLSNRLELDANRFAFAIASNDEAKVEGAHSEAILYVFDESKTIPAAIWDAAEGALSVGEAYALAVSTPGDSVGRFYDIQARKPGYEEWYVINITKDEVIAAGRMSQVWADAKKRQWGETSTMYQRRVEGNFAEDSTETVIPLRYIEAAQERWREAQAQIESLVDSGASLQQAKSIVLGAFKILGVDPARFGDDNSGIAHRYDRGIYEVESIEHADTMQLAGRVKSIIDGSEYGVIALIDTNGLGAGTYDRLKEQEVPVVCISVSTKSEFTDRTKQLKFHRYRDWLYWNMRDLLTEENTTIILPPDDDLSADLTAAKYNYMSNGAIYVLPKDDMKSILGRSPDKGEAVIYSFGKIKGIRKVKIGFV